MSLSTFLELKNALSEVLGRAPADVVYHLVTSEINRDLRLLPMEATATLAEAETVSLPSGFLEPVSVYRDATPRSQLDATDPNAIHADYQTSGTPTKYAVVDDAGTKKLLLDAPGSGQNLVIRYIAELAALSSDDDTNNVLTQYPNVYFYGSLYHHALTIADDRVTGWGAAFRDAKERAKISDTGNRSSVIAEPTAPGATP